MTKAQFKLTFIGLLLILAFGAKDGLQAQQTGFDETQIWHDTFCYGFEWCTLGDINGDGRDDILAFTQRPANNPEDGFVWTALSTGSRFEQSAVWHEDFCYGSEMCKVGDVNGDGRADILAFVRNINDDNDRRVWVALSTGSGFGEATIWQESFCERDALCEVADVNGDGRDDIIHLTHGRRGSPTPTWVALSTGSGFGEATIWFEDFCYSDQSCTVGDVTGDDRADLVVYSVGSTVLVAASNGSAFELSGPPWGSNLCRSLQDICTTGDVNGDGLEDAVIITRQGAAAGRVTIYASSGSDFTESIGTASDFCFTDMECMTADVNGDDRADLVGFISTTVSGSSEADVKIALTNANMTTAATQEDIPATSNTSLSAGSSNLPGIAVEPGVPVNGVSSHFEETDILNRGIFYVAEGSEIRVSIEAADPNAADEYFGISLLDPNGDILDHQYDAVPITLYGVAEQPGMYVVTVQSGDPQTFTLTVEYERMPAGADQPVTASQPEGEATPGDGFIEIGQTVEGTLEALPDGTVNMAEWTFQAEAGQTIVIFMEAPHQEGETFYLEGPDNFRGYSGGHTDRSEQFGPSTISIAGEYLITVALDDPGAYTLSVLDIPAISRGQTINGNLASGRADYYFFDAAAGEELTIAAETPNFDLEVNIYNASGDHLINDLGFSGSGITIQERLPSSERYLLEVTAFSDDLRSGAYTLNLNLQIPPTATLRPTSTPRPTETPEPTPTRPAVETFVVSGEPLTETYLDQWLEYGIYYPAGWTVYPLEDQPSLFVLSNKPESDPFSDPAPDETRVIFSAGTRFINQDEFAMAERTVTEGFTGLRPTETILYSVDGKLLAANDFSTGSINGINGSAMVSAYSPQRFVIGTAISGSPEQWQADRATIMSMVTTGYEPTNAELAAGRTAVTLSDPVDTLVPYPTAGFILGYPENFTEGFAEDFPDVGAITAILGFGATITGPEDDPAPLTIFVSRISGGELGTVLGLLNNADLALNPDTLELVNINGRPGALLEGTMAVLPVARILYLTVKAENGDIFLISAFRIGMPVEDYLLPYLYSIAASVR